MLALGGDEAHDAERGDRAAGARAADDEREAAGLDRGRVAKFGYGRHGFRAFQDREIGRRIAAGERRGDDAAVCEA